jgi:type III restriction enzyme
MYLSDKLKSKVLEWREKNYECDFPLISEILDYNYDTQTKSLRFLRKAQFEALETYWFLRIVEDTPHIFELYKRYFKGKEFLKSIDLLKLFKDFPDEFIEDSFIESIVNKIINDEDFTSKYKLETLRETILLKYPSYILALAMGAGKTILISSIIATEFAMALEYPDNNFVKNALVFAPGKTILGALKEISDTPFEKILPPRLYKEFITTVKFTYTRDGEKDIPIIKGSSFNIIVTNTEKIRIQKQSITKGLIKDLFLNEIQEDVIKQEVANRRLQTIASLPNLAIFSDEAHHTYGMSLGEELKKVRKTVDYLAENTNLIVVVNTTGTPYFKKQILKDVVYWYSLSQGIKDGILKEVKGNIVAFDDVEDEVFIKEVVKDFFANYKEVRIFDGSSAKLAIYFPQLTDLQNAKPIVEKTLIEIGLDPSIILEVHHESKPEIAELFDYKINDPYLPYRVFLLVNKGTEGWNCLSLFATALARELRSSNNFCLQAASRCLRQTPGNIYKAKIYLSKENVKILDTQLRETYGENLRELNLISADLRKEKIVIRKTEIPQFVIKKKVKRIVSFKEKIDFSSINFKLPEVFYKTPTLHYYEIKDSPDIKGMLIRTGEIKLQVDEEFTDIYSLSVELSSLYRLPLMMTYEKLKNIYPDGNIPETHVQEIKKQLETMIGKYEINEEEIEVALALVKINNFNREKKEGNIIYTTEIVYHKDKEDLLLKYEQFKIHNENWYNLDFGFHYTPYNFDSKPEKNFFIQILSMLNENPDDVEDIYFTGAITDPNKTDFIFEYKGKDGRWHNYTPDFLIKKKNGKILIVEIKAEPYRDPEKEKAIKEIEGLNPDKLKYEILITDRNEIGFENINKVKEEIYGYGGKNV